MAGSLAMTLVSKGRAANTARSGDTIVAQFSSPPDQATDVTITISQVVMSGGQATNSPFVFSKGAISNKTYSGATVISGKTSTSRVGGSMYTPPTHMTFTLQLGSQTANIQLTDAGFVDPVPANAASPFVLSNALQVSVTGKIAGVDQTFEGKTLLQIIYPQAMIVPALSNAHDPAIAVLPKWAAQWKAKDTKNRFTFSLPVITYNASASITDASYAALITAMTNAVAAAPGGIIALTVGHGDGGFGKNVAWCDLLAEDGKVDDHTYNRNFSIDESELGDGSGGEVSPGIRRSLPSGGTATKLKALDKIADIFTATPIRKLLLHTCEAGNSLIFTQRMADRLRCEIQAHTQQIEYTGNVQGSIQAAYAGDTPVNPGALTEWPVSAVAAERDPSPTPPPRMP